MPGGEASRASGGRPLSVPVSSRGRCDDDPRERDPDGPPRRTGGPRPGPPAKDGDDGRPLRPPRDGLRGPPGWMAGELRHGGLGAREDIHRAARPLPHGRGHLRVRRGDGDPGGPPRGGPRGARGRRQAPRGHGHEHLRPRLRGRARGRLRLDGSQGLRGCDDGPRSGGEHRGRYGRHRGPLLRPEGGQGRDERGPREQRGPGGRVDRGRDVRLELRGERVRPLRGPDDRGDPRAVGEGVP